MIAERFLDAKALSGVVCIAASESVAEAAGRMKAEGIGCLLVVEGQRYVGILTEKDLVARVIAADLPVGETLVRGVMTPDLVSCASEASLSELQELMNLHGIRHLPIRDDEDVVGLLSSRDLMQHAAEYDRHARELTIFAMAKLAENRDPETGGHLERVRDYAAVLAGWLSRQPDFEQTVDAEFISLLRTSSALHDIGKVSIPDCVLLKPGRLSEEEFDLMKTHTLAGAETLGEALEQFPEARFLQMAYDIAAYHHERTDGKGYPEGRAGEDIPLCARIFALADVYDALVSKRVYKRAMPHPVARHIILDGAGTQFDPLVIEAFCASEQQFRAIHQRYDAVPAG